MKPPKHLTNKSGSAIAAILNKNRQRLRAGCKLPKGS
jgi:hypothetical protein